MQVSIRDVTLRLCEGDITRLEVDAIVNAANASLAGGGGVDGAIHRAGGRSIMEETRLRYPDGCATGSAVITAAGNLPAKHVIHAVGPRYRDGRHQEAQHLSDAYRRSLELAVEHECRSIAFPALSMGAYGYPPEEAARIALATAIEFAQRHNAPREVCFVLFGHRALDTFVEALRNLVDGDSIVESSPTDD